jgi:hypothetical protein
LRFPPCQHSRCRRSGLSTVRKLACNGLDGSDTSADPCFALRRLEDWRVVSMPWRRSGRRSGLPLKPDSWATEKNELSALKATAKAKGCLTGSRTGRVFILSRRTCRSGGIGCGCMHAEQAVEKGLWAERGGGCHEAAFVAHVSSNRGDVVVGSCNVGGGAGWVRAWGEALPGWHRCHAPKLHGSSRNGCWA